MYQYRKAYTLLAVIRVLIVLILLQVHAPGTLGKTSVRHRPPEIATAGYAKEDSLEMVPAEEEFRSQSIYQNFVISKNGSDFIVSAHTRVIAFTCESTYPITWKFPLPEQLESPMNRDMTAMEYRISDFGQNNLNPVNKGYKLLISLKLISVTFLSVNLTCAAVENGVDVQSSIYIYLAGKSAMEHEGKNMSISVEQESKKHYSALVIPCRPASPDIKLLLQKEFVNTTSTKNGKTEQRRTWRSLSLAKEHVTFDPKVGFRFGHGRIGNATFGLYRCSVVYPNDNGIDERDEDKFVLVNVTQRIINSNVTSNTSVQKIFEPGYSHVGNASIGIYIPFTKLRTHRSKIVCCSGIKDKPPKLYTGYCTNPLSCEIKRKVFADRLAAGILHLDSPRVKPSFGKSNRKSKFTDCVEGYFAAASSLVICTGDTIDFRQQFVHLFRVELNGPMEGRFQRARADDKIYGTTADKRLATLSTYQAEASATDVTQRIAIILGNMISSSDKIRRKIWHAPPIVFTRAYEPDMDVVTANYSANISIREYDRDVFYGGELLTFMCLGVRYFYANGPHMRLNWRNGTWTILKPVAYSRSIQMINLYLAGNAVMFDGFGADIVPMFAQTVVARPEMSSIDCWMPERSSDNWDKISKMIEISPSVPPTFVEATDEVVNFYLGDVDKVVTCTVLEGVPHPTFKLTKAGKEIPVAWKNITKPITKPNPDEMLTNESCQIGSVDIDQHLMKLRIPFKKITYADQNVWTCTTKNVNGTATRIIRVVVIKRPSVAMPVSLTIAGVLCIIAIGFGVKHWRKRRRIERTREIIRRRFNIT